MKISGFALKTKASTLCGGFTENLQDIKPIVFFLKTNKQKTPAPSPNRKKASKINPRVLV